MAKPTLILCPGAWHGPDSFSLVKPKLEAAGHKIIEVDWPSVSRPTKVHSLDDDIAYLTAILTTEADAGNDVVIVSHSWAGLPVSSTAGTFSATERAKLGKNGGVVRLLFVAAFVAPVGVSIFDAVGQEVPPLWDVQGDVVYTNNPESAFYNDFPEAEQKLWASKLRGHAKATKYAKMRGEAYMSIPSWYLQCEEDQAIPPVVQAGMVQSLADQGADIKTEVVKSGHSPFLSKPDETADFILRGSIV